MESGLVDPIVDPRRIVRLDAVHNFRDLGGYPARDGLLTRWRTIYRADGLYRLSDADVEVIRGLGLRTVVDLRTQRELDERGTFPHQLIEVHFTHHPVIDTTWAVEDQVDREAHEFLVWAYTDMLGQGAARFAGAITQLAQPGALPAVFHCAAGKDRTGMLAAMLLGALGVPRSIVLADYGLTAGAMERMRAWATREYPELAERMAETPSAFLAALPDALGDVLASIEAEHGSIGDYVGTIGVTPEVLDALAASFLTAP
ncbi:MAG: tyrosine-protein phosphatase [Acidimicrobiales bacterium]